MSLFDYTEKLSVNTFKLEGFWYWSLTPHGGFNLKNNPNHGPFRTETLAILDAEEKLPLFNFYGERS